MVDAFSQFGRSRVNPKNIHVMIHLAVFPTRNWLEWRGCVIPVRAYEEPINQREWERLREDMRIDRATVHWESVIMRWTESRKISAAHTTPSIPLQGVIINWIYLIQYFCAFGRITPSVSLTIIPFVRKFTVPNLFLTLLA